MPKRCCCIIPLRGGTVLISLAVAIVSGLLLALTFTHKNPMVMHLAGIHTVLPWVYTIFLGVSAAVGLYGLLASTVGNLFLMRFYKFLFWLLTILVTIWQTGSFVLALINRSKTLAACNEANPSSNSTAPASGNQTSVGKDTSFTFAGYNTTFLGMQTGNTYGLANCDQAVQAGVILLAVFLFLGAIFMFYFASVVGSYATKLRERSLGHRLRDAEWDDNIDDLASSYRADARDAPKYPLKNMSKSSGGSFSNGLKKLGFGKK
ncbi:hypothetical protein CLU79DRAFT_143495 [Phycomyces nitens]|nr:hypothetical protein CLU79DRAFT_143495 [Phycomyces nitens]